VHVCTRACACKLAVSERRRNARRFRGSFANELH
jgi:hypothetical protein